MRGSRTREALVALTLLAGCSGGGGGSSNSRPVPVILEPHESSSHLPGNVAFDGRASDEEDGTLLPAALSWQVLDADGDVVGGFQGDSSTLSLLVAGEYTAILTAEDSKGKRRSVEHPFHIANTVVEIQNPNNESVIGIADPFDIDGRAETVSVGVFLSTLTFVGIDESTDDEVFRLPVAVPAGQQIFQTTVTPSLPAGRFKIHLEVATTSPTELAEDNIRLLADAAPVVSITSPADGTQAATAASVQFSSIVTDAGGGVPTLEWSSSVDGALSTELDFTTSSLTRAKHRVTLTATDENGLRGRASVEVYVEDPGAPLFVDVGGLPDPDVRSLAVKAATPDAIWVGTVDGIANVAADTGIVSGSHTTAYNAGGTGSANSAACITSGECLFGIAGLSVSVRDAGDTAWSTFTTGLTSPVVNGIAESPVDGHLFFATDQGITETDAARANPVAHDQNALQNAVTSVTVGGDGIVWAGTADAGLVRLQLPTTVQAFNEDDGLADNFVHAVAVDGDGIVWVGTEQGLSRFDPVANEFTEFNDELPDQQVLALALDGDILWIGTGDGAARYDTTNDLWSYFDEADLAGRVVHAVAVDTDGAVWLGCGPGMGGTGGLTRYDGP